MHVPLITPNSFQNNANTNSAAESNLITTNNTLLIKECTSIIKAGNMPPISLHQYPSTHLI